MGLSLLFFFLYVAIVVVIGITSSRKETEEDFMIAERRVQGFQVAATMSAGYFDGSILAIYLAYIYQYGFSAIWAFVGFGLGFLLLRKYASKIKNKADAIRAYSMPEYFYRLLGRRNALMFSFFLILQYFLLLIVNLIVSGKVLLSIFPISFAIGVLLGGTIILSYLLLAGFKAVIRTDYFQLIIMFLMSISVAIFLLGKTPHIPTTEFDLGNLGVGNAVAFLVLTAFGLLVAPDLWQRIFATKDDYNLKRGFAYSALILPLLGIVLTVIGLATKQFFPNIVPEDALIIGFSQLLPFGFKELGMVLLYAVALSSSDTITFVVSSILTRDLNNYTLKYSEESMRKLTRRFMVAFVVLAIIISIVYQNILNLGLSLASLNLALFPAVFGTFYWKLKEKAVFWSLVAAFLSVAVIFIGDYLNPETAVISFPIALIALLILQKTLPSSAENGNLAPSERVS